MLSYLNLSRKPALFRSFTGLSVGEFNQLYGLVEGLYAAYEFRRLDRKDRVNAVGQGRDFKLDLRERLLMFLVYHRLYITYTLAGFMFDLDQSNVCRNIRYLTRLVKKCVPLPQKVHKRARKLRTLEEVQEYFPDFKAIVDGTEQEIPRPENRRRRKSHYSGKKKKHTVKTQMLVNKDGVILHKTRYEPGSVHDYGLWKKTHPKVPPDVTVDADLGYLGIQKDFPHLKTHLPIKKREGERLSKKARKHNRKLSRERVKVEHVISRVKKFNIIGQEFRNRLRHYNDIMDVVTGIVNYKVMLSLGMNVASYVG